MVAAVRNDILGFDGGMVDVPGPVNFHFNFRSFEREVTEAQIQTVRRRAKLAHRRS